jgi:hypothetical protein
MPRLKSWRRCLAAVALALDHLPRSADHRRSRSSRHRCRAKLWAPGAGGTPQPVVDRLNRRCATLAMDAVIDREEAKFSALIKELGLKPQ